VLSTATEGVAAVTQDDQGRTTLWRQDGSAVSRERKEMIGELSRDEMVRLAHERLGRKTEARSLSSNGTPGEWFSGAVVDTETAPKAARLRAFLGQPISSNGSRSFYQRSIKGGEALIEIDNGIQEVVRLELRTAQVLRYRITNRYVRSNGKLVRELAFAEQFDDSGKVRNTVAITVTGMQLRPSGDQ
jgi:hypothetical protein